MGTVQKPKEQRPFSKCKLTLKKIQRMKGTSYGVLNWKSSKLKYQT